LIYTKLILKKIAYSIRANDLYEFTETWIGYKETGLMKAKKGEIDVKGSNLAFMEFWGLAGMISCL
jgi:hypothetical protein